MSFAPATGIRSLMREAHRAGARVIHFPEGATCSPNKRIMSANGPREIGSADWSRFEWDDLSEELDAISKLARELRLWTIVGSVHRLTPPHRPHNSLYVLPIKANLLTAMMSECFRIRKSRSCTRLAKSR